MELKIKIGKLLFNIWFKSPWISGANKIPFKPLIARGLMPYKVKSKFHVLLIKNIIQITDKNSNGYLITDKNSFKGKPLMFCKLSKNIPSTKRLTLKNTFSHTVTLKQKKHLNGGAFDL